jgi:predicted DNA-binding transcriptional regulator YafY
MQDPQEIFILYTNHRGENSIRRIVPHRVFFGSTEWHPEPQWLLEADDLEKDARRSFAMRDIHRWSVTRFVHDGSESS